jgi:hypothetical protein
LIVNKECTPFKGFPIFHLVTPCLISGHSDEGIPGKTQMVNRPHPLLILRRF